MGPDATNYEMIERGGRLGDMRLGDGGQAAVSRGADFEASIKTLWLFDLEADPTETSDLSSKFPAKVEELRAALDKAGRIKDAPAANPWAKRLHTLVRRRRGEQRAPVPTHQLHKQLCAADAWAPPAKPS